MVDPRVDPVGWLLSQKQTQPLMGQLDRVEVLLLELLSEIRTARRCPLGACTASTRAAQTTSVRGFFLPQEERAAGNQTTYPERRCSELTDTAPTESP